MIHDDGVHRTEEHADERNGHSTSDEGRNEPDDEFQTLKEIN
jgi:hypothetical protein